ncbi:hypothetical protein L6452_10984 [Arctium lappa]|uniref:Uncharacterized protein n=1 Tax=Arctium lappa TaxID=4217 RepID=A0ACB9DN46_ARCLA|nr:hypothetical protein L6452_10984 [Arctium lappa]
MAGDVHGRREGQKAWLWLGTLVETTKETNLQINIKFSRLQWKHGIKGVSKESYVHRKFRSMLPPSLQSYQTTSPVHNETVQQPNTSDRDSIFGSSDDNVIMKQVFDTHVPDDTDVDVKPLLHIVEDILKQATIHAGSTSTVVEHTDVAKPHQTNGVVMLNSVSHIINRLASEMSFKCLSGGEVHTTALALFHAMGNFHWEAKLVLTLSAFALNYGEFWLLAQIHSSNQLARSMAIFRQVPMIKEHSPPLEPRFDPLNKLLRSVLELTQCIIDFKDLPSMYISSDVEALASALNTIPTAVYWSIRGIIACAAQITSFTSMGHEYRISSTEFRSLKMYTLNLKIDRILEFLKKQLKICHRVIEDKREMEHRNSFNQLFDTIHIDNMKILKTLISPRDDILPLFDGSTKQRVKLEVLRKRNVLLLISGLDMSRHELSILQQFYNESRIQETRMDALYEVVWMPIIDPSVEYTEAMDRKFEEMRNKMPWYSVYHPLQQVDPRRHHE